MGIHYGFQVLTLDQTTNKHDFKLQVSDSNPKGNLGTDKQAGSRKGSTTTPSVALAQIKCQLTLGGAQTTMYDPRSNKQT